MRKTQSAHRITKRPEITLYTDRKEKRGTTLPRIQRRGLCLARRNKPTTQSPIDQACTKKVWTIHDNQGHIPHGFQT